MNVFDNGLPLFDCPIFNGILQEDLSDLEDDEDDRMLSAAELLGGYGEEEEEEYY